MILVSVILLSYKNKNEDYKIADSLEFQYTTYSDEYKKTSELSDEDLNDNYQKNYQETSLADGSHLRKTAEWTNKANGEALITIQGSQFKEQEVPENTTALYVATLCYQHGLTENILVENVLTLIKYYDSVDFIAINDWREEGIVDLKRFTANSTEDEIRTYISETKASSSNNVPHYINSIPVAIQKYLFGNMGDEYIDEDNLINDPTAIYVSCDSMYLGYYSWEDWGMEYATEKYFNFMEEKYGKRYFTMSQSSQQSETPFITIRYPASTSYDANAINIIL